MQISRQDFLTGIKRLTVFYNYNMPEEQVEAYYIKIKDRFTPEKFSKAVETIVETEPRFPALCVFWAMSIKDSMPYY